jgi:hypothetical protein
MPRDRVTRPHVAQLTLSRRRLLAATGTVAGAALLAARPWATEAALDPTATPQPTPPPGGPPPEAIATHRSRPDLRAPVLTMDASGDAGDEALFLTPRFGGGGEGVMIFDATGGLVWMRRVPGRSSVALQPIVHRGRPALWWWEGVITDGLGDGEFVIIDDRYREIARIRAMARPADLHDLAFTRDGDALLFALDHVSVGGQPIVDYLIQQIEIATGRLVWEWRASDHIALEEMVEAPPADHPWDFVHFNSIDVDPDGDLLVSARHTDALYLISRRTGDIIWRLGGTRSDLRLSENAVFHRQHFARFQPDGTISLFDNATSDPDDSTSVPRGLVLRLDEAAGVAELVAELKPPRPVNASSQGNLHLDPDGIATIGWGSANLFTVYDADGSIILDGSMPPGFTSYRAFRHGWRGRPMDVPIAVTGLDDQGVPTLWVSWNGATDVAGWRLMSGDHAGSLRGVVEVPRSGFETAIPLPVTGPVFAVAALDVRGRELARSELIRSV